MPHVVGRHELCVWKPVTPPSIYGCTVWSCPPRVAGSRALCSCRGHMWVGGVTLPQCIAEPSGSEPHTSTPRSLPRDLLPAALPSRLQAWGNVPHLSTPCLPGTALSLALYFSVTGIWPASCPGACQPCNLGSGVGWGATLFLPGGEGCLWLLPEPGGVLGRLGLGPQGQGRAYIFSSRDGLRGRGTSPT